MATTVRETLLGRGISETFDLSGQPQVVQRDSPFDRIHEEREQLRAMALEDAMDADIATRRAEAELKRTTAEAQTAELSASLRAMSAQASGGGTGEVMAAIIEMMRSDKAALIEANRELAGQINAIQQRVAEDIRAATTAAATKDDLDVVTKSIQTYQTMISAMKSLMPEVAPSPPAPAGPVASVRDQIELMRASAEIRRTDMEAEEKHRERLADWDLRAKRAEFEMGIERERFDADKGRMETVARTLEQFAPHAIRVFSDVIGSRFGPGAAAPVVEAQTVQGTVTSDGREVIPCPAGCGASIPVPPDATTIVCPGCRQMFGAEVTPN